MSAAVCLSCRLRDCDERDLGCAWRQLRAQKQTAKHRGAAQRAAVLRYRARHPAMYHSAQIVYQREQRLDRVVSRMRGRWHDG